jgi:hypothetical protein
MIDGDLSYKYAGCLRDLEAVHLDKPYYISHTWDHSSGVTSFHYIIIFADTLDEETVDQVYALEGEAEYSADCRYLLS